MKLTLCLSAALTVGLSQPASSQAQHLLLVSSREPAPRLSAQADPPPQANSTVKDDLFAGTEKFAKGASSVDEVNMDPESLSMVGGPDAHRAHGMVLSVVRTYTYDKPGMYNPADVEVYRQKLETGDWHCSIHTRDRNGESTDICNRRREPDLIENAIITASPKSLTFIHNIRKARPQGSSVESGDFSGFSLVPGLPLTASMAVLNAEMQGQMSRFGAQMRQMQPRMPEFATQMHSFHLNLSPEQRRQIDGMTRHLHRLPAPPASPAPPAVPAPPTV